MTPKEKLKHITDIYNSEVGYGAGEAAMAALLMLSRMVKQRHSNPDTGQYWYIGSYLVASRWSKGTISFNWDSLLSGLRYEEQIKRWEGTA